MEKFTSSEIVDFKHVIYNLLVENHNDPANNRLVVPYTREDPSPSTKGRTISRTGFQFNVVLRPEKFVPELYAKHLRQAHLDNEDGSSILVQDLYKFYLRACTELMSKYFEKVDKWTYLYYLDGLPLFVPNEDLFEARNRLRKMKTRARMMTQTNQVRKRKSIQ